MIRRILAPAIGFGMAAAGLDKVAGDRNYQRLYKGWGWTREQMRLSGLVELLGGLLMANRRTRRLGGAVMVGSSAVMLSTELRHRHDAMAAARSIVLLTALIALLGSSRS